MLVHANGPEAHISVCVFVVRPAHAQSALFELLVVKHTSKLFIASQGSQAVFIYAFCMILIVLFMFLKRLHLRLIATVCQWLMLVLHY